MVKEFGKIFWIHLILILAAWSSPFWINWKFILFFIFLYYIQIFVIGDCILTRRQFNSKKREMTFYYFYLTKMGFKVDKKKIKFLADFVFPWIIFFIAVLWQIVIPKLL